MSNVIYLTFATGTSCYVGCGSDSSLDNMGISRYPQITWECWARLNGYGGSNAGRLISKSQTTPLYLEQSSTSLVAQHSASITDKISKIPFTPDNDWHHFACTYNNSGDSLYHLFIDGVEGTYSVQQAGASMLSDAANPLILGNNYTGGAYGTDGDIAWVRITQSVLYSSTFTPPDRCSIPTPDDDTVGLWITEGTGATTYNLGFATGDGAITGATWGTESCGGGVRWQVV